MGAIIHTLQEVEWSPVCRIFLFKPFKGICFPFAQPPNIGCALAVFRKGHFDFDFDFDFDVLILYFHFSLEYPIVYNVLSVWFELLLLRLPSAYWCPAAWFILPMANW